MKRYKAYMDGVTPSDTLKEKLKGMEAPKRTGRGKWYGVAAAAAAVVVCLGAAGLHFGSDALAEWAGDGDFHGTVEIGRPEPGDPQLDPDLDPGLPDSTTEIGGGYTVTDGGTAAYYYLPAIRYGESEPASADWAPKPGVTRQELSEAELLALFPGESDLSGHLNWGGYTLSAYAMTEEDGTLWMLGICGEGDSPFDHFELNVMPGEIPPTCLIFGEEESNEIWGTEVKAARHDGKNGSAMQVTFMHGGYGYRFVLQTAGGDPDELVARLVRYVTVGGGFSGETPDGDGDPGNQEATTSPYDPNGGGEANTGDYAPGD